MDDVASIGNRASVVAIVAAAATAATVCLVVRHPRAETSARHSPTLRVSYRQARFTAGDARRAFAAVGIRLILRSRVPGVVTTLGTQDDSIEVDVFGDPAKVEAAGSPDLITDGHGTPVRIPGVCTPGIADAARRLRNVRVVIPCSSPAHAQLLATGARALSKL